MDLARSLLRLRPGAAFTITNNDYATLEWLDPRTIPTLAELDAIWVTIQAEDAAAAQAASTATTNAAAIKAKFDAALAANDAFLALGSPTQAQVLNQVRILTRECTGLFRLAAEKLDSTSGT